MFPSNRSRGRDSGSSRQNNFRWQGANAVPLPNPAQVKEDRKRKAARDAIEEQTKLVYEEMENQLLCDSDEDDGEEYSSFDLITRTVPVLATSRRRCSPSKSPYMSPYKRSPSHDDFVKREPKSSPPLPEGSFLFWPLHQEFSSRRSHRRSSRRHRRSSSSSSCSSRESIVCEEGRIIYEGSERGSRLRFKGRTRNLKKHNYENFKSEAEVVSADPTRSFIYALYPAHANYNYNRLDDNLAVSDCPTNVLMALNNLHIVYDTKIGTSVAEGKPARLHLLELGQSTYENFSTEEIFDGSRLGGVYARRQIMTMRQRKNYWYF